MAPLAPPGAGLGPAEPLTKLTDPLNRWSAWVTIDDKPVEVYKVAHEGKKSTCYIEAVEGEEFQLVFAAHNKAGDGTQARVCPEVDGMAMNGVVFRTETPWTWEGKRVSDQAVRPFTFAKTSLTDDSNLATTSEAVIKKLGTICFPVLRCLNIRDSTAPNVYKDDAKQHTIDERSKKAAISHQAGFGAVRSAAISGNPVHVTYVDKEDSPFYVLEFKYRSRALLELEDIVEPLPRTSPSPAPASPARSPKAALKSPDIKGKKRKTDVITLSDDDDDETDLRAKVARLEAENAKLKSGGVKAEKKPKVKDEPLRMNIKKENGQMVIHLLD